MKKKLLIFFLLIASTGFAQERSRVKISLLTCAPGEELYSTFGHTAIRVLDSSKGTDSVFNYGLFDFSEPDFYMKFTRGSLNYILGVQTFQEFLYEYQLAGRSVWEQDIDLNDRQKQSVMRFLSNNALPENRAYRYDFIYDNCATRARDVILREFPGYVLEKPYMQQGTTARNLFHYYLDNGKTQAWSKLGIDVLLGAGIDTAMNNFTGMFLPEFLMKAFENTTYEGNSVVRAKRTLVQGNDIRKPNYYAPFTAIALFSALLFLLYYFNREKKLLLLILDSFLLFITGSLGVLLLFMWFGTEHASCRNNYNLLWALPANLVVAFMTGKRKRWLKGYFFLAMIISALLSVLWFFLPQHMNFALLPFVLLMVYRYFTLYSGAKRL